MKYSFFTLAGLQIDIDKCEFETSRVKYLGLIVRPGSIEMDPEKITAITSWQTPSCVKDIQRFIGFANFYRRFIKDFSKICVPLNTLLCKSTTWKWDNEQDQAFKQLKQAFVTAPVLAIFDYTKFYLFQFSYSILCFNLFWIYLFCYFLLFHLFYHCLCFHITAVLSPG